MLAEAEEEDELELEDSGVAAAIQADSASIQASPEAHSQFGAVLVDSKHIVQDLLQLEEQVLHPWAQARQLSALAVNP
jgi:hypothetical protein